MSEEIRGAHRLIAHHDDKRAEKAAQAPQESGTWTSRGAYRPDPNPRLDSFSDFLAEMYGT